MCRTTNTDLYRRINILINLLKGLEVKKIPTFSRNFCREVKKNHSYIVPQWVTRESILILFPGGQSKLREIKQNCAKLEYQSLQFEVEVEKLLISCKQRDLTEKQAPGKSILYFSRVPRGKSIKYFSRVVKSIVFYVKSIDICVKCQFFT